MPEHHFVICANNTGLEASLELRKIYEVLVDSDTERHGQIRVIDESGEDYLFPASRFIAVELPQEVVGPNSPRLIKIHHRSSFGTSKILCVLCNDYAMLASPLSPVRTRTASSMRLMKIFPSPILPVDAAFAIAFTTRSTASSVTTTSSFIFG